MRQNLIFDAFVFAKYILNLIFGRKPEQPGELTIFLNHLLFANHSVFDSVWRHGIRIRFGRVVRVT